MYALRGIAVSLSVFLMVYCALSLAVRVTWKTVRDWTRRHGVARSADMLFALRVLPLLAAALVTAAFTVPSFLLLEPRSIDEPLGVIPLVLGACGALLGLIAIANAARAIWKARRAISMWTTGAKPVLTPAPLPVLRISHVVPAMTAVGVIRSKILFSGAAESMLGEGELRTAMNHELAHVRRRDNLKKLLFCFVAFPGMLELEAAWLEATEMAADDAAVSNADEALDLAAALIKLSRLTPTVAVDLTAALVHSPGFLMNARVERLIAWNGERRAAARSPWGWYGLTAALATVAVLAVIYSPLLADVHTATEWLVR